MLVGGTVMTILGGGIYVSCVICCLWQIWQTSISFLKLSKFPQVYCVAAFYFAHVKGETRKGDE